MTERGVGGGRREGRRAGAGRAEEEEKVTVEEEEETQEGEGRCVGGEGRGGRELCVSSLVMRVSWNERDFSISVERAAWREEGERERGSE